uniref:Uncharacterized protein n=1 Tax=Arundo donax TaxID=35708 RepID=A0A0A9DRG0_ARUDO
MPMFMVSCTPDLTDRLYWGGGGKGYPLQFSVLDRNTIDHVFYYPTKMHAYAHNGAYTALHIAPYTP